MNNSAVRSTSRLIPLSEIEPLPVASTPQARASSADAPAGLAWPPPIGSEAAEALMSEMRAAYRGVIEAAPVVPPPHAPKADVPRLPKGTVTKLPVVLNAEARDYARIWIVNLLLTVLTVGLYLPWARVRSQRFFLRRTMVGGSALDYHAPPVANLPRYGLAVALVAGVLGACVGSPLAGLLAFSMALAVLPLAVHTSLIHRMAHTSWGGRRLRFKGEFAAVYRALLMPLVGLLAVAWLTLAGVTFHHPMWWAALGSVLALWLLGVPLFLWGYFRYRQARLQMGPLRLDWTASPRAMVMLWARTAALAVLVAALVAGLGSLVLGALMWWRGPAQGPWVWGIAAVSLVAVLVAVTPYVQARLQNLVWSKTGSRSLRFKSSLSVQDYVLLQARHAALLVLTLGLYWPWAVVASRRMRTEALTVWARVDTEVLKAHWTPFAQSSAGLAAERRASA